MAERKLLKAGITISAKVNVTGFGNIVTKAVKTGIIAEVFPENMKVVYEGGSIRKTKFDEVLAIEGMDINRFAQAYKLKPNKKSKK
jgi:hypothetical protein